MKSSIVNTSQVFTILLNSNNDSSMWHSRFANIPQCRVRKTYSSWAQSEKVGTTLSVNLMVFEITMGWNPCPCHRGIIWIRWVETGKHTLTCKQSRFMGLGGSTARNTEMEEPAFIILGYLAADAMWPGLCLTFLLLCPSLTGWTMSFRTLCQNTPLLPGFLLSGCHGNKKSTQESNKHFKDEEIINSHRSGRRNQNRK